MARHSPEELAREERRYIQIWIWLAVLTLLELGATKLQIPKFTIGIVLIILALTKAALVGLYYMHLVSEKRTLMYIALTPLILCAWLVFMLRPDVGSSRRVWTTQAPVAHEAHHE
jgi:caa(3)-type oxidase subunit IV